MLTQAGLLLPFILAEHVASPTCLKKALFTILIAVALDEFTDVGLLAYLFLQAQSLLLSHPKISMHSSCSLT